MTENMYTVAERNGECLTLIALPLPVRGFHEFLCSWLLQDKDETVLIDCGVGGSYPHLKACLDFLGAVPDLLLFTHIHLDHSGGAGLLVRDFPDIKIFCFERSAKHLISPQKLWEATSATLGKELADAYEPPLPVPAQNLIPRTELHHSWKVLDTPGHAPHHVSFIRDFAGHKICFGGEALGVFPGTEAASWFKDRDVSDGLRPATPPRYIPDIGRQSMKKIDAEEWDLFCGGHYGSSTDRTLPARALKQSFLWEKTISEALNDGMTEDEIVRLMLTADPELQDINFYTEEDRDREVYFLHNSVRGFMQFLTLNENLRL